MTTALVYDERFLEHDTGLGHPERPARLESIISRLKQGHLWDQLDHLPVVPAEVGQVERVHDPVYVRRVRAACEAGESHIDCADSAICPMSFDTAMLAAGGVLTAVDAVMRGPWRRDAQGRAGVRNAFCAVRPPGHHAERDRSMGFCLFNNIAIAAEHLLHHHGLDRVAIVDFDVHHGNGTQHHFEDRAQVLFISLHEHPLSLYPGTGFAWEKGRDAGEGHTINIPMQPRGGDGEYRHAFLSTVLPALDQYKPQFLLISAGFDASEFDPLAHMHVSAEGFLWMTRQLKMAAERLCGGRLVSVLEGGYELRSLAECVALHVGVLLQPEGHDDLMAMKAGL